MTTEFYCRECYNRLSNEVKDANSAIFGYRKQLQDVFLTRNCSCGEQATLVMGKDFKELMALFPDNNQTIVM